jgi:hypothetical protein
MSWRSISPSWRGEPQAAMGTNLKSELRVSGFPRAHPALTMPRLITILRRFNDEAEAGTQHDPWAKDL